MASVPVRAAAAERALPTGTSPAEAAAQAAAGTGAPADLNGSRGYREHLAGSSSGGRWASHAHGPETADSAAAIKLAG
jgi:CO/xanthine dehydrogenase FAD-binding subunit